MSIVFEYRPSPKPQHGRNKPKRGTVTKVKNNVRDEVNRRSMELMDVDVPVCERCGSSKDLTKAHMEAAAQGGSGSEPWNIVNLCGTHGTKQCHEWADNTPEGLKWKKKKRVDLLSYYLMGEGRNHWKLSAKETR